MSNPDQLQKQLNLLKFRWKNACEQYVTAYPDYAVNPQNNTNYSRVWQTVVKTYQDIQLFKAKMVGIVANTNGFLKSKDDRINKEKDLYQSQRVKLETQLGANNASPTFKKDKYYENNESYIFATYYVIALLSITFFLYKQGTNKTVMFTILFVCLMVLLYYYIMG